jgi:hypothetical protein
MSRKNESVTISINESEKEALIKLAVENNCIYGTEGNISLLMRKIARGQLALFAGTSQYEISQLLESREVRRLYQLLQEQFEKID